MGDDMSRPIRPEVASYYHEPTATISHVAFDRGSRAAAIIDPVLDFDMTSGRTSTESADRMLRLARAEGLDVKWILETHIHADHLTAAPYLKQRLGGEIGVGARVGAVQRRCNEMFNLDEGAEALPDQFDRLFEEGDEFKIGGLVARVMFTPGHTDIDVTYLIGDAAFIGDTLFMPDVGTARADFPGGDARVLYRSIQKILDLPENTRLFHCHDYPPKGRGPRWESTVAEQRRNVLLADGGEDDFVARREARDKTLDLPRLFYASLQINIRAGLAPPPEDNGASYLKLPVK
jgi:glyoxylase-like metal-dependent hydrolase (beta-lactamase superfamily II)